MRKLELIPFVFWLMAAWFAFANNVLMTAISAALLIASEVVLCYVQFNRK